MKTSRHVVICGAGIAGASAAHFLTQAGIKDVLLVDERSPLSLTSDRSTECYRNWWPDPAMLALMDHSIDLLGQLASTSANMFRMNRRGYLYLTADSRTADEMESQALAISESGGGPVRVHTRQADGYRPASPEGYLTAAPGADLLRGTDVVQRHFPYVTAAACAGLHVRRAGWLSAQQLGMHLIEQARNAGVAFRSARIVGVETAAGRVGGVQLDDGEEIACDVFINAAGPFFAPVGRMLGLQLPVEAEVHLKVAFEDPLRVLRRDAPLLIWNDPQYLPWQPEEIGQIRADPDLASMLDQFPAGVHTRPEGGADSASILMLWDYQTRVTEPVIPVPLDEQYPAIVLRGLSAVLPGLTAYIGHATRPRMDGGYYVRTRENRPLIGPTRVQGSYLIGALSGFGIMAACAAGELLARHVAGLPLPFYADAFTLQRYDDAGYLESLQELDTSGEL